VPAIHIIRKIIGNAPFAGSKKTVTAPNPNSGIQSNGKMIFIKNVCIEDIVLLMMPVI
jgi:hypothetical protein